MHLYVLLLTARPHTAEKLAQEKQAIAELTMEHDQVSFALVQSFPDSAYP